MRSAGVRSQKSGEQIVSFDEALATVEEQAAKVNLPDTERVAITEAVGRVLASAVVADRDQPPFDRSTRDGYAVRSSEAMRGGWLQVAGQIPAGACWDEHLQAGHTLAIMTGAPVPPDTDAVVMLEHVEENNLTDQPGIRLSEGRKIAAGSNIVPRGSEARAGDVVLKQGTRMDPAAIALAAGCGAATLDVFLRPKVSIVATGDELVDVTETPGPQQIRNSNSYGLAALVIEAGGTPLVKPIARDQREALETSIREARAADLMLLTGGVSMGEYDLVEKVLLSMGARFFFTGVTMQPGKPAVFGQLPEKDGAPAVYFFGLPGNPVSTQVTFACFVATMLKALAGCGIEAPRFAQATLMERVEGRPGLTRVLPARLTSNRARPEVKLVVWQGSGDMGANARANCYAVLPGDTAHFEPETVITILLR